MKKETIFYYGVEYFRPPNPPRGQLRYHLEKIKHELGFNIVRVWYEWNACERKPGVYDFSEYNEILSICDDLGLNVLVQTSLEDAPYWLERECPQCRYVNAKGYAEPLSGNDNHPSGGHPGLCLDNPMIKTYGEKFLTALARSVKDHPATLGYDCWNEPHIEPNWNTLYWADQGDLLFCYCPGSVTEFLKWMKNKYPTVEAVNVAWKRYFDQWEDIAPPRRHGTFADWLDWWQFWFDNLQAQMRWRYQVLKKADPDHFVKSHSGGIPPVLARIESGINNFALAKEVDFWGTSCAPLAQNWTTAEAAAACEVTRSAAHGKEYWIDELQAGYCQEPGLHKCPRPEPKHIRSWNWLAAVYGAKGILYWCYLTESTGNEAQGFGLIRYNGQTTARAKEASRTFKLMQKYEPLFIRHSPAADVAILYEPDSSSILFAQEGTDKWISNSHVAYYRTVWNADLYARWVTFEDLPTMTEKVLIIPMHYLLTETAARQIRRYVSEGGIVIAENGLGTFDPNGLLQPQIPPYGLAEVFGLEENENFFTWTGYQSVSNQPFNGRYGSEIERGPRIALNEPTAADFKAYGFVTPLTPTTAKPLGGWNGHVLAAQNTFGKGKTFYFGTFMGLSYFNGEKEAGKVIGEILTRTITPAVRGQNLRPRLIEAGNEGLLCVFNNSRVETFREAVALPVKFNRAVDAYGEKEISMVNHRIEITVEPECVAVFYLDRS